MKIPFFSKKEKQSKNYLGLFLKDNEGVGFVICEKDSKLAIVEKETFTYSNSWNNLINDVDELLFKFENKTKLQLNEVIFFVYSHLINENSKEIKREYFTKIKELVKNLELKALGYIECHEAVAKYLEKDEELPLTAILLELDKTYLGVFIYKGGRISYYKILPRTENLINDLMISFNELKGKFLLPSRIVLYNSKDLDAESAKILSFRWSEELFIQLPRVEIIREEKLLQSLIRIFEEQIIIQSNIFDKAREESEVMGFTIGRDVAKKKEIEEPRVYPQKNILSDFYSKIKILINKLKQPVTYVSKKLNFLIGAVFIILALLSNEYFFHKAKLTIYLPSLNIEKSLKIKGYLDGNQTDGLKIYTATIAADFSESKATTGKREIGEKAKGEVTIHNFNDREKNFAKGTTIEGNSLKFSLDSDIKVASASYSSDVYNPIITTGKAKVKVTALAIGQEGNLNKGTRFKIGDYPITQYYAVNETSFTEGSKKEIRTVSKADIDDLKSTIVEKSKNQKQDQIKKQLSDEDRIFSELTQTFLSNIKPSAEVGEESKNITLRAKVNTVAFYYKKNQLIDYVVNAIKNEIEKGYKLEKEKITYDFDKVDAKEGSKIINLNLTVKIKPIKDISGGEILKKITGKKENDIKKILKDEFGVEGYKLSIEPPLPILKNYLPFFQKSIGIKMSSL